MNMVFQDPFSSLSPRMPVIDIIGEPLRAQGCAAPRARGAGDGHGRRVGLEVGHLNRYPNAFCGGQRQRICIARALVTNPLLVVADEPVSALDVSIQAQILNLLQDLQDELGLSYLFVAHNLSVVEHIADRLAVMYVGRIVELAPTEALFARPRHPYTEALLSAVPRPDPAAKDKTIILAGRDRQRRDAAARLRFPSALPLRPADLRDDDAAARAKSRRGTVAACHFAARARPSPARRRADAMIKSVSKAIRIMNLFSAPRRGCRSPRSAAGSACRRARRTTS